MCPSLIVSFSDMMQGDNGNIKEVLGIALLINYLEIYLIHCCIIAFCPYNEMALYNIPTVFKIFALLTCISRMFHLLNKPHKFKCNSDTY